MSPKALASPEPRALVPESCLEPCPACTGLTQRQFVRENYRKPEFSQQELPKFPKPARASAAWWQRPAQPRPSILPLAPGEKPAPNSWASTARLFQRRLSAYSDFQNQDGLSQKRHRFYLIALDGFFFIHQFAQKMSVPT